MSGRVMGALIAVHRELGPGLLENAYQTCVAAELRHRGIAFREQVQVPLRYRDEVVKRAFVADLLVEESLLVELKAVEAFTSVHVSQTITYLRLLGLASALLVNFHVTELRLGVRRIALPPRSPGTK